MEHPFEETNYLSDTAKSFVCALYTGDSKERDIDQIRMEMFCQKTRDIERIPPTENAFEHHFRRSLFQSSLWASANLPMIPVKSPLEFSWSKKSEKLEPIWTTLHLAKDALNLDIKCKCKRCDSQKCKCTVSKLKCSRLCKCSCFQTKL